MKKTIGMTQRVAIDKNGTIYEYLEKDYIIYYSQFFNIIPISNFSNNLEEIIKKFNIEGFILTGGNNVNPKLYGCKKDIGDISEERDKKEFEIIGYSQKNKLPVLGVCRGCQLINVYFKGKISQVSKDIHIAESHKITLTNGNIIITNSYHSFGISNENLGEGLLELGTYENTIEYFKHKQSPIIGIMWHPERIKIKQDDDFNKQLITELFNLN